VLSAVRIWLGAKLRRKIESWDVIQEVMMAALGKVTSFEYRTEGAFLKYLNHLVENRLRDEADRQGAARRDADREISLGARSDADGDPLKQIDDPSTPTPSRLLILGEDLARMERAMDRLSPEHRELIVAVKLEGQTYRELADGATEDAIRMKVNRAEEKLAAPSASESIILAHHWRYRKWPGLVLSIVSGRVHRVASARSRQK
jgi:RNA polymerase sigma factor (sigma-70 family)